MQWWQRERKRGVVTFEWSTVLLIAHIISKPPNTRICRSWFFRLHVFLCFLLFPSSSKRCYWVVLIRSMGFGSWSGSEFIGSGSFSWNFLSLFFFFLFFFLSFSTPKKKRRIRKTFSNTLFENNFFKLFYKLKVCLEIKMFLIYF